MAQLKSLPSPVGVKDQWEKRCAKVLLIINMNNPIDDVANRMVCIYNGFGIKKSIICMKDWGSQVRLNGRLNSAEDAASEEMNVDFSQQFFRTADLMPIGIDPADRRASPKDGELIKFMEADLWESSDIIPPRFRQLVYDNNLYRDTLAAADFIATSPVAASNHFRGMFKPDLVYFARFLMLGSFQT
ncbi:hypothetical protein MMYC01_210002 [Madurella mycetomatis]|uniref:Uncharacterized protein n=1 Tax=Madurella mycetomatis TaxID=100816 RepID=A0A175VSP1_9PEZI|nr:hypothetical protein MMYC01_210002 [Madurella mycetomatis]